MSSVEDRITGPFGLDDRGWLRHANPWSVYTRIPIPVLLVAAIWSYAWIGWWSLLPVTVVAVWTMINPRVFPPPRTYDRWASRSVLGERLWLNRKQVPVPARHRLAPQLLGALSALGVPFIVWGLVVLDVWIVLFGLAVQMAGKLWLLDRMALLYGDMNGSTS